MRAGRGKAISTARVGLPLCEAAQPHSQVIPLHPFDSAGRGIISGVGLIREASAKNPAHLYPQARPALLHNDTKELDLVCLDHKAKPFLDLDLWLSYTIHTDGHFAL